MAIRITEEQRNALNQQPEGVKCEDDQTQQVYVLVEESVHERAMDALKRQQDIDAIAEGIADMQAGRGMPVAEADEHLRKKLGFSPRQAS